LLGAALFWSGLQLEGWQTPQARLYNEGLILYEQARNDPMKIDAAILAFDQSLDDYNASVERSLIDKLIYPCRSDEIAALALSKKAVLYLLKDKGEDAIRAFKMSININSGQVHPDLIAVTIPNQQFSPEEIARLAEQAKVTIHNLEMLFSKKPSLQKAQGKGQGKGKGYDPEPAPGTKPAPGAGKSSNPDAI
jgi:hypothetical protein